MSKLSHAIFHGLAIIAQYASLASGVVPVKYQPLVAAIIGAIQAGVALSNHK